MQQIADWLEKLGMLHVRGQWVVAAAVDRDETKRRMLEIVEPCHWATYIMTISMVALSPRRSASSGVRRLRLLIAAGAIAFLSSILILDLQAYAQTSPPATGARENLSDATAVVAPSVKDKNLHLSTISKALVNEASRLKNDAAGWDQKLQELELDLKKNQQDVEAIAKDIADCLVVLRTAADRLAPDAEARGTFRQQEGSLREVASRAEVHSDPAVRKTASYFQRKTTELRALNRSVEETRIELITQIDRLEAQLEFNGGAGQMSELVRGGRAILNGIQAIAANALQLANNLDDLGRTPEVAANPADATGSTEHVPDAGRSRAKFTPLLATPPRRTPTSGASKRGPSPH